MDTTKKQCLGAGSNLKTLGGSKSNVLETAVSKWVLAADTKVMSPGFFGRTFCSSEEIESQDCLLLERDTLGKKAVHARKPINERNDPERHCSKLLSGCLLVLIVYIHPSLGDHS